jgi:hypothetical protein
MKQQHAQILCEDCKNWIPVEGESGTVPCECGSRLS